MDLTDTKICDSDVCGITRLILVTNTKFTSTAQSYAECAGLELLSWNYPRDNNLQDRIEKLGYTQLPCCSPSHNHKNGRFLLRELLFVRIYLKSQRYSVMYI